DKGLQNLGLGKAFGLERQPVTGPQVTVGQDSGFVRTPRPFRQVARVDRLQVGDAMRHDLQGRTRDDGQDAGLAFDAIGRDTNQLEQVGLRRTRLVPGNSQSIGAANLVLELDFPQLAVVISATDVRADNFNVFERGGDFEPQLFDRRILNFIVHQRATANKRLGKGENVDDFGAEPRLDGFGGYRQFPGRG